MNIKLNTKKVFFILSFLVVTLSVFVEVQAQFGTNNSNYINRTGYACTPRYLNCATNTDGRTSNLIEDIELKRVTPRKPNGYSYDKPDRLIKELQDIYGDNSSFVCYKPSDAGKLVDISATSEILISELKIQQTNVGYSNIITDRVGSLFVNYLKDDGIAMGILSEIVTGTPLLEDFELQDKVHAGFLKSTLQQFATVSLNVHNYANVNSIDNLDDLYIYALATSKNTIKISSSDGAAIFTLPDSASRQLLDEFNSDSRGDLLANAYGAADIILLEISDEGNDIQRFINIDVQSVINRITNNPSNFSSIYEQVQNDSIKSSTGSAFTAGEKKYFRLLLRLYSFFELFSKNDPGHNYNFFTEVSGLSTYTTVFNTQLSIESGETGVQFNTFPELVTLLQPFGSEGTNFIDSVMNGSFTLEINRASNQEFIFSGTGVTSVKNDVGSAATIGSDMSCKLAGGCALVASNAKLLAGATTNADGTIQGQVKATGNKLYFAVTSETIQSYTKAEAALNGELSCQRCYANGEAMSIEELSGGDEYNVYICNTAVAGNVTVRKGVGSLEATLGALITDSANQPYYNSCIQSGGIYTAIGCVDPTPIGIITGLIRIALGVVGGIALLQMVYVGILYQIGQEDKIKEARSRLIATITGVAVLIFSILILRIIGVNVLDILPAGSI